MENRNENFEQKKRDDGFEPKHRYYRYQRDIFPTVQDIVRKSVPHNELHEWSPPTIADKYWLVGKVIEYHNGIITGPCNECCIPYVEAREQDREHDRCERGSHKCNFISYDKCDTCRRYIPSGPCMFHRKMILENNVPEFVSMNYNCDGTICIHYDNK